MVVLLVLLVLLRMYARMCHPTMRALGTHAPRTRHARARPAPGMREACARQRGVTTITRSTIVHRYLTGPIEFIQARDVL